MENNKSRFSKGDVLVLNPYDPKGLPVKKEELVFAKVVSVEEDHYVVGFPFQEYKIPLKNTSRCRVATTEELEIFEEKDAILWLGILRDS